MKIFLDSANIDEIKDLKFITSNTIFKEYCYLIFI